MYVDLLASVPTQAPPPVPLPDPELDEGPHLSYTIQWFIFSVSRDRRVGAGDPSVGADAAVGWSERSHAIRSRGQRAPQRAAADAPTTAAR